MIDIMVLGMRSVSIVFIEFSKGEKNQYLFSRGSDSFFLALSFYLLIFSWVTVALVTLFSTPSFSSLLSYPVSSHFSLARSPCPFVSSFFSSSPLSLCARMWACVAKNPALGLHCLFHVRTSGDIKGPQGGPSVCISPALTVCCPGP